MTAEVLVAPAQEVQPTALTLVRCGHWKLEAGGILAESIPATTAAHTATIGGTMAAVAWRWRLATGGSKEAGGQPTATSVTDYGPVQGDGFLNLGA